MHFAAPITSKTNARVKALRAAFSGRADEPGELLGIEGETLLSEAARSGIAFETIFLREGSESVLDRPLLAGLTAANWVVLDRDVFASAVNTSSPQGIAATFSIPTIAAPRQQGTILVLEDLQDPGNLGTLIRSAEAFGVQQIFCTPATVSAWNPKTVRASAGSVFRIPVTRAPLAHIAAQLKQSHTRLVAAVARSADAASSFEANLSGNCALMIGNEGAGLSHEALSAADERVHIPCATESLNAAIAGSTLLYEALRQNSEALRQNSEAARQNRRSR